MVAGFHFLEVKTMTERRTRQFMLALTPSERETLQRLSERDGSSAADVVRRLILAEARQPIAAGLQSPKFDIGNPAQA